MNTCKVISHTMTIEYICPENKQEHRITIENPSIYEGQYYEDWHYTWVEVKTCPICGKSHGFEI